GFGVREGLAGSSSGASTSSAQTIRPTVTRTAQMNSARTRCGQVWTLSSPGPTAFLMLTSIRFAELGVLPGALTVAMIRLLDGVRASETARLRRHVQQPDDHPEQDRENQNSHRPLVEPRRSSERRAGEAVAPDAPEVDGEEEARHERDEDAVQDVEPQQRVRAHLAAAEQERARVVDRVHAEQLLERPLVSEERRRRSEE